MALILRITDGTITHDLTDITKHYVREDGIQTIPAAQVATRAGARFTDGQTPAFNWNDNRLIAMKVIWRGTSADAIKDNVKNVNLMIQNSILYFTTLGARGKKATFQANLNGTNLTEWIILGGIADQGDWANTTALMTAPYLLSGEIRLECLPFASEPGDIGNVYLSPYANSGAIVTVTGIRGDVTDFPAKFVLSPTQDLNNAHCWIARRTRGNTANLQYVIEAEASSPGGYTTSNIAGGLATYSSVAVGTARSGHHARWAYVGTQPNPIALGRAVIAVNVADNYGQFHWWARVKQGGSSTAFTLQGKYGTKVSPTNALAPVAVTMGGVGVWQMVDLGIINWPDVLAPAGVNVAMLVFELYSNFLDANTTLDVDYFLLAPTDEAFIDLDFVGHVVPAGYQIVVDGTSLPPAIYVLDGSNNLDAALTAAANGGRTGSFPKLAAGDQLFLVYCDSKASDLLADTFSFDLIHRPPYHWLRGS